MRYKTKDEAFTVRQITMDELIADAEETVLPGEPEFKVRISSVANGWWTRAELSALHTRLGELLARRVPRQVFFVPGTDLTIAAEDAARLHGFLPGRVEDSTREELEAAITEMIQARQADPARFEIPAD